MSDPLSPSQRHICMSHIRSNDTKPEKKVRQALFRSGFRYRVNVKTLPGTPDIVLPKSILTNNILLFNKRFAH